MAQYKKVVAENRKAFFDYHILDTFEAGIVLNGNEVKSIRIGRVNLRDSFARQEKGELWLFNMHVSPYKFGRIDDINPLRQRKLLLNKSEMKISPDFFTAMPFATHISAVKGLPPSPI